MSEDPFERFERSRGGWLIPIALFIAGSIATAIAIQKISLLDMAEQVPADELNADELNIDDGNQQEGVQPEPEPTEPELPLTGDQVRESSEPRGDENE
ncbi:MAG: hypothetical protein AAGG48_10520 [Planctomycetota bacterium]